MNCRRGLLPLICASVLLAGSVGLGWAEDGELFPNVKSYDDDVPAPVTKPEKSMDKPKAAPVAPAPVIPPVPRPDEEPKPDTTPVPPPVVKQELKISWVSYRGRLIAPLLSPESQDRFDKEFAPLIQSLLSARGSAITQGASSLWKDGEGAGMALDLKTVLWLHSLGLSLRDTSELEDRATKAQAVLPLLTAETLPMAQARVDAVTGLAFGALSKASDELLGLALESECKLVRMQVQCGYPEEAVVHRKLASDIYGYLKQKSDAQKFMLAEAGAWVDRATAAQGLSAGWAKTLAGKPNDAAANTQLAILNLSLFGDVEKAATYAGKSDRKELKDFAAAFAALKARGADMALNPADTVALAKALLGVAENGGGQPFDQFSIALLARGKLEELSAQPGIPGAQVEQSRGLLAKASGLVVKSGIRPPVFGALAALQGGGEGKTGAPGGASKLQLFVKDNGTVVKYIKPTATQNAEALKLIRAYVKDMSEKTQLKFTEVETDHCLVITDWPASQRAFLKKNVEGAYLTVAKAFDYPVNENVFPGKLPVIMLATHEEFLAYTKAENGRVMMATTGLFNTTGSGIGYVMMYQPDSESRDPNLLTAWGRTLTWNMGFAFEARYRTNKSLPRWLNQGLAAHVAFTAFPLDSSAEMVQMYATMDSIEVLFGNVGSNMDTQAVYASVVEMLMSRDKKAFVDFVNKLKDGEENDVALKETFHCTVAEMCKAWKAWIAKQQGG